MEEWLSFVISSLVEEAGEIGTPISFPFTADAVAAVYTLRFHEEENDGMNGDGLWFRLTDGRMFDGLGQPDRAPLSAFEDPFPPEKTASVAALVMGRLQSESADFIASLS
jgi:hypothetical protein